MGNPTRAVILNSSLYRHALMESITTSDGKRRFGCALGSSTLDAGFPKSNTEVDVRSDANIMMVKKVVPSIIYSR